MCSGNLPQAAFSRSSSWSIRADLVATAPDFEPRLDRERRNSLPELLVTESSSSPLGGNFHQIDRAQRNNLLGSRTAEAKRR
jgi:hypothetical protein